MGGLRGPHEACVFLQREEGELQHTWVEYHAAIFDYRYLHILDHGSSCPKTNHYPKEAERSGAHVTWHSYRSMSFTL